MSGHSQPAPVVLFVYNRPRHAAKTLAALAQNTMAAATPLYIMSDGPKRAADARAVAEVRQIARAQVGSGRFADVMLIESADNKGLASAIVDGVSLVMDHHGEAIVLEDDLVAAPDFLTFMNACLRFYERDPLIGSVAGYGPLSVMPAGVTGDVYALPRNGSHGWATWNDRWRAVDWSVKGYEAFRADRTARTRFDRAGADRAQRLDREMAGEASTWSIRFGFWQFTSGKLTVYPRENRILNIGGDGSGVHGARGFAFNRTLVARPKPFKLVPLREDWRVVEAAARLYGGGPGRRMARRIKAMAKVWSPSFERAGPRSSSFAKP